jgi:uncharacterized protein
VAHRPLGTDALEAHLPVLLSPALTSTGHAGDKTEADTRIQARSLRAWGRFRQAAVSSFAFVEAAGPAYAVKLVKDALALNARTAAHEPAPRIEGGMTAEAKSATAAAVLNAMSLTTGHAPLVLLLGHGAQVTNNPHESAYHCGACGGHTGEVSARLLAQLLNDPETRAGLPEKGIVLPEDTVFVAGLHDTTTDTVTLHEDGLTPGQRAGLPRAMNLLARARRDGSGRAGAAAAGAKPPPGRSRRGRTTGPKSGPSGACRLRRLHRGTAGGDGEGRSRRAGLPAQL